MQIFRMNYRFPAIGDPQETSNMPVKPKDLLHQLAELQSALDGFSFDHLNTREARELKGSFEAFRQQLESRIWNPDATAAQPAATTLPSATDEASMLIATVSHDIRTPLNGILNFTELLEESGLQPEQAQYLGAIRTASHTLLEILNELLEYSKLNAGLDTPQQIPFSPEQVFQQVSYLCRTLIVDGEVKYGLHLQSKLPQTLLGDPSKLSQVLMNLLGNAIKFVRKGRIDLIVRAQRSGNTCRLYLEVADTGPGIPEAELPVIFEPFRQAGNSVENGKKGVGLGLSIVKKIIERQQGTISVESRVGKGTSFRFELEYQVPELQKEAVQPPAAAEEKPLSGYRVLIFEDDPLNRRMMETRLASWGCVVFSAHQPAYGLGLLQQELIDAVLMDLRMPEMDGYQVSRRIREDSRSAHIPIIAVTAHFTGDDRYKCREAGIDEVLLKPFAAEELRTLLLEKRKEGSGRRTIPTAGTETPSENWTLDGVWKECMGDLDMLEELTRLLKNNILEFFGKMKLHIANSDYAQIAAAAHKLKAGLKLIEANDWLEYVANMMARARQGRELLAIESDYEKMRLAYPQRERQLDMELSLIKTSHKK